MWCPAFRPVRPRRPFAAGKFRLGSERSLRLGSRELEAARDNAPAIGRDGSEFRVSYESGLAGRRCAKFRKVLELAEFV